MSKKSSLSIKLAIVMTILVAGIIGFCCLVNVLFLEKFYTSTKQEELLKVFSVIEEAYEGNTLSESSFDVTFENICAKGNLDILIVDSQSKVVRSSSPDVQALLRLLNEMITFGGEINGGNLNPGDRDHKFDGQYQAIVDILVEGENYSVLRQQDARLSSEYLVLWGKFGDNCHVYMRTALESIRESAAITNSFFLGVGAFGIFVGILVIFFIARNITRPIKELTAVSKDMAELKFEVKYLPQKQDSRELAELGEHMNNMAYTLEKTISDLKAANNELQLDIARKEQMDEMRKEFLSNVSHELKTPIALILGYAEGLSDGMAEDEASRNYYCEVIVDEANKMNRMVKQLLTLNQLEFGNDKVEMSRFNISEMITSVVGANQILAEQDGISLEFLGKGPEYVWGDEFKVEQVLTNYISNAMHHASGEKNIRIYYEKKEDKLRICVFNTGNLIPEEEMDRIWEKFYKVDKARTRAYGGSGVGLSIVKAIMDSLNQRCGVRNLTNGVEFWLELENSCNKD